jgi:monomeric sarcosine oxidase
VKLAVDALRRWRSLESDTGTKLLTHTGALLLGRRRKSFETECYEALRSLGLEAELLESRDVRLRFPQFNADALSYGVYDPSGAILHAERAMRALIDRAKQLGVEIVERARVIAIKQAAESYVSIVNESGREILCERAMVASGPWSRNLLPFLADKLTTTRQEIVYFKPSVESSPTFEPAIFPIFLELESGFYGFPIHHAGAMKIANHHKGAKVDPDSAADQVGEPFIESCRAFFAEFIPALADARVVETRVCIYNNTPDDDFIMDWHPQLDNVLIVTGFSGHGFKFGTTIGRIAADLLTAGHTSHNIDGFRLVRFSDSLTPGEPGEHSVRAQ